MWYSGLDPLRLEKIEADEGASVQFDDVLLIGEGSDIKVGNPVLAGSSVSAKVLRQGKSNRKGQRQHTKHSRRACCKR